MKRNLLFILFAMVYTFGNAQVVFYVQPPSVFEGNYTLTYADSASADWSVPNLENPVNAVVGGELIMALDGSATEDSLVCDPPVINDITGKVAVLYRGACEFGAKAFAAQEAGAIAVVIINHTGLPIEMGGGADGANVTIPVVMISQGAGANLRDAILAGGMTVFIGNKNGFYNNDIGIKTYGPVRARYASNVQMLAQDDTEFEVQTGAWVTNFGSNDQTNVVLSAIINLDGSELYNESATAVDILSGDSAFVALPTFSQTNYDLGVYEMTYSLASDSTDDFPADDMLMANFRMSENLFSYAEIADEAEGPSNVKYTSSTTTGGELHSCIIFQDPNGSRVAPVGLTFSTSTFGEGLDGEVVSVYLYEWTLQFEDVLDPLYTGIDEIDLDLLASGVYEYVGDDLSGLNLYVPFEDVIELEDDVRYLMCVATESETVRFGHDVTSMDYQTTQDTYLQVMYPLSDGAEWFDGGFGTDWVPGISAHLIDVNAVGVDEVSNNIDVTPYPNPAQNMIQIPLNDVNGLTTIQIFNVAGKLVEMQTVSVSAGQVLKVNVSNLENGVYTFGLRYEDGNVSNFNVVIAK